MISKNRYITLTVLLGAALLLGVAVPAVVSFRQPQQQAALPALPTQTAAPQRPADVVEAAAGPVEVSNEQTPICTYPLHYWKDRPGQWPAQVVLGGQVYNRADAQALLGQQPDEVGVHLAQQVYTAFLNILAGANYTVIEGVLMDAAAWLDANPLGSRPSELSQREGAYLAQIMENYNLGEIGPGACADVPALSDYQAEAAAPEGDPSEGDTPRGVTPAVSPVAEGAARLPPPPLQFPAALPPAAQPTAVPPASSPPTATQVIPTPVPPTATAVPPTATTAPPTPVPPTATSVPPTSPPPAANLDLSCAGSNIQPKAEALAKEFGVSYAEIMSWNCKGWGFGEIERAYSLSRETGVSAARIFEMSASGMSWGDIRKSLKP
jgi:hypothetical protein